jgi:hypothetical protein
MSLVESYASLGKPIDVGSFDERMTVAANVTIQIVTNEKQDIGFLSALTQWSNAYQQDSQSSESNKHGNPVSRSTERI